FTGHDLRQQARAGQTFFDDGDRCRRRSDMVMTLGAGVLETYVLPDEQTRRLVIELLADLLAELPTYFAAAGTDALSFRQRMLDAWSRQVGGQPLAAVPGTLGLGRRAVLVVVGRRGRRRRGSIIIGAGGCQLREQPGLVGIEAFGLGPVQPTQQLIETLLQPFALVLRLLQSVEQFQNHLLERSRIIRQGRHDGASGNSRWE